MSKTKARNVPSTQAFLDILEIKDDVILMKDGTLRAVLLISSVNFSLKAEDEQVAVIQAYTQFLNTLSFPLQIVIQSRRLNIDEYLERLKQTEKTQTNELLKIQIGEYRNFVAELVEIADIMTKRFYAIVPYQEGKSGPKRFFRRGVEAFSPTTVIHLKQEKFQKLRFELLKRVDYVMDGISSSGLKAVTLDTQSLIELFYNTYNPESFQQEKLVDLNQLNLEA